MCVVSNIMDDFYERWNRQPFVPYSPGYVPYTEEDNSDKIEKLRKEIDALKELLPSVKKFDEVTGQPDCESEEKIEKFKKIAEIAGIDVDEIVEILSGRKKD